MRDGVPKVQEAEETQQPCQPACSCANPGDHACHPLRAPLSRKAKATHAHGKELAPAPSDNDPLSSVPSDTEKKGAAKQHAAATRRSNRVGELQPPPFPEDALKAAFIDPTFVKEFQKKLDEFEEKDTAAKEALVALRASADAVQQTVETFVATWMARDQ
ncbi:uncharacterized protein N7515_009324 [Penicillium bovifimosum]|uniref:Uncharacterized protein n=1 Tax=Penicillium bovifimosum TaxID=126998 RepID=A0A9W9GJ27_9EURO|nr:uncharacterized protein N7515_009324 [Penicillium bovifimosum]KAJ5121363.1 hypothetical protein N7515_009324 [Penicillium bovifimosum]